VIYSLLVFPGRGFGVPLPGTIGLIILETSFQDASALQIRNNGIVL